MTAAGQTEALRRRILRLTRLFLVLAMIGVIYRGYWIYSQSDHAGALAGYLAFLHGTGPAPFQYRAAPVFVAGFFYNHFHWPFRYGFTLEDFVCSFAAVLGGYEILRRRPFLREASPATLAVASITYAAFVLYLFSWQDYYKKNETDVAAFLTVLLMFAWSSPSEPDTPSPNIPLRALGIAAVTLVLSLVRADIAISMSFGAFAVAFLRPQAALALSRTAALATAAASIVLAAAMQALLTKVVFPHAAHYESAVFMLPHDIGNPAHVLVCAAYALPTFWALSAAWREHITPDAAGLAMAVGSVPFFLLWITLGRMEEVRIFLPVGLAAAPLAAQMAAITFARAEDTFARTEN